MPFQAPGLCFGTLPRYRAINITYSPSSLILTTAIPYLEKFRSCIALY